ncbi:signal transduction histidine kinase [Kineosphaera limosa]|nr:histidine kinase [Kineosphaera limosa]NYD98893.1 signal transduction histidine kinase [Kineosphaera limosa]
MDQPDRPVLRSRAWSIALVGIAVLALALATTSIGDAAQATVVLTAAASGAVAMLLWAQVRSRRERGAYEDALTGWAAERAKQAERMRLARELHDLASHGLGLITVRAAAAQTVRGSGRADEQAAALADIEDAGRAATLELRRMLAVLRSPADSAPRKPGESLADLPSIVAGATVAGVRATLAIETGGQVSPGAQLLACAVVREGLTNTGRHAGPAQARVLVAREGDSLVVTVEDEPVPGWAPHPGAGVGLAGLRERVQALGGTVCAGPGPTGFRLVARLPEPSAAETPDRHPSAGEPGGAGRKPGAWRSVAPGR